MMNFGYEQTLAEQHNQQLQAQASRESLWKKLFR